MKDVLFIKINQRYKENMTEEELYEATRGIWKLDLVRCNNDIKYVLALYKNTILEIYKVDQWFKAGETNYNTRTPDLNAPSAKGRIEFVGKIAYDLNDIRSQLIGQNVSRYYKRGEANPAKYISFEQLLHDFNINK